MSDGSSLKRDGMQVFPCIFDGFFDRSGNFVGLSEPDPYLSLPIAHHNQCVEAEAPAALDDLGHAVDVDDLVDEFVFRAVSVVSQKPVLLCL